ncbi:hypothetical protein FA95DRAFT_1374613 [Auriscalpium vulgare]|uniref:Uncharacterized protein n=1 Tax=Auriscalpium vulgare TaxID=40419 RepID=A0ACB8RRQ2_9AGAM|nr:hypothetical protein FA95DRAFT_1374613 [Auriscalpium vulgare]
MHINPAECLAVILLNWHSAPCSLPFPHSRSPALPPKMHDNMFSMPVDFAHPQTATGASFPVGQQVIAPIAANFATPSNYHSSTNSSLYGALGPEPLPLVDHPAVAMPSPHGGPRLPYPIPNHASTSSIHPAALQFQPFSPLGVPTPPVPSPPMLSLADAPTEHHHVSASPRGALVPVRRVGATRVVAVVKTGKEYRPPGHPVLTGTLDYIPAEYREHITRLYIGCKKCDAKDRRRHYYTHGHRERVAEVCAEAADAMIMVICPGYLSKTCGMKDPVGGRGDSLRIHRGTCRAYQSNSEWKELGLLYVTVVHSEVCAMRKDKQRGAAMVAQKVEEAMQSIRNAAAHAPFALALPQAASTSTSAPPSEQNTASPLSLAAASSARSSPALQTPPSHPSAADAVHYLPSLDGRAARTTKVLGRYDPYALPHTRPSTDAIRSLDEVAQARDLAEYSPEPTGPLLSLDGLESMWATEVGADLSDPSPLDALYRPAVDYFDFDFSSS